jgi:uncharacterized heparinase superfamily protein
MSQVHFAAHARMAAHLRPSQVAHRARLRTQRAVLRRWPQTLRLLRSPNSVTAQGWPAGFHPVDARLTTHWPSLDEVRQGDIRLLEVTRKLGDPADWHQADAPLLWRFHLHYWDWAWGLTADSDRAQARAVFARLWQSWRDTVGPDQDDGWLPYPTALRAWSWCGLYGDLIAGSDLEARFVRDLATHSSYLRRHLEYDVGGNHLIKDLKALVGLAVFFADTRLLNQTLGRLTDQLAVQVLPDGGHFERAPAYHCQVLADLIDVSQLMRAAGRIPPPEIDQAIDRMRRWLAAVQAADGSVPLFNDGYPVPDGLVTALELEPRPDGALLTLPYTGLIRATVGGWHMIADVGSPCPDDLPGHAHADTLSCLLYADGAPVLVDTGTSTYAPGTRRDYERSTAAHNTVEVDGSDSTEVWAAFRTGRRARVRLITASARAGGVIVEASHDGFRALSGRPQHRRRWFLTAEGLQVQDDVTGRGRHVVVVWWHIAAGSDVRPTDAGAEIMTSAGPLEVHVSATAPATITADVSAVATGFGRTVNAPVLACRVETGLPVRISTSWRRPGFGQDNTTRATIDKAVDASALPAGVVPAEGAVGKKTSSRSRGGHVGMLGLRYAVAVPVRALSPAGSLRTRRDVQVLTQSSLLATVRGSHHPACEHLMLARTASHPGGY